jgi:hypothetical protein
MIWCLVFFFCDSLSFANEYSFVTLCVVVCGCVWLCVVVCGCVWLCVVVCGCVCVCVCVYFSQAVFT